MKIRAGALDILALPDEFDRRNALQAFEVPRQVALVGEADVGRNLGQGEPVGDDETPGGGDPLAVDYATFGLWYHKTGGRVNGN